MKNHYYQTCDSCGANLDPGEICDCQKNEELSNNKINGGLEMCTTSETFLVAFDAEENDLHCLQISKVTNGTLTVTNIYYGEEADDLRAKLINTI